MTISLSNSLAGLSLLTGTNSFAAFGSATSVESRAVRLAKAQFDTPVITPPWKEAPSNSPAAVQVSAIKRMTTVIDKPSQGLADQPDISTAFTSYKALDRLRLLAESAAKATTSSAERLTLQTAFAKGLDDLRTFLASAPSDRVQLSFGQPTRRAESVALPTPPILEVNFPGVIGARDAPLPGVNGDEVFEIKLSTPGTNDTVTVDLSTTPQPPTLDSIADAFNAAISAIPLRNADGSVSLDEDGNPQPRWLARFVPNKDTNGWGFSLTSMGIEQVAIEQINAKDSLVVATGQTAFDAPATTRIFRVDDAAGAMERRTLTDIAAIDRMATDRAALTAPKKPLAVGGVAAPSSDIMAATNAKAIATDSEGFSYVVGTTAGEFGGQLSDGKDDLFLTKLDSEGRIVWHRSLGAAGQSEGAAVSVAPNGDVVVAGTVSGAFDGSESDGDLLVARFDAAGNEKFATLIRSAGADSASAVAVGSDGSVFVGGRSAAGSGNAFLARIDANGLLQERRSIDSGGSDSVTALAVDGAGALIALTNEAGTARVRRIDAQSLGSDLATYDLGAADARALTIGDDGTIAIAGATRTALSGSQANGLSGGRDGFAATIDAGLSSARISYLGTGGDDQVDSVAFMNGALYVGGRTTGDLAATRKGVVDGFVSRIDPASGAIAQTSQFGQAALRTEPVRISAAPRGATSLGALGLNRGTINGEISTKLVSQTSLRAGDEFAFQVDDGSVRKVTITAEDTLLSLADRIRRLTGSSVTVSTPKTEDGRVLRIEPKAGHSIDLLAGADGKDALGKLGLAPASIVTPATVPTNAPKVRPGGAFGLDLTRALDLSTAKNAAVALDRISAAVSMTQTAFRSLYWDDAKAALADGGTLGGRVSAYQAAQAGRYQAALDRLSSGGGGGTPSLLGF